MATPPSILPSKLNFTKAERLCGQLRFKELITTGKAVYERPMKLVGKKMELPTDQPAQVAFAVPRRYMRKAVHRNRMRRLMREAWRLNKAPYQARIRDGRDQCAWLFIFQGRTPLTFSETQLKITRSLDRWMNEHG